MKPKAKRRIRPLTILAYIVTAGFTGMILFPLFMIASYAARDHTALNRDPSALIPECAKTMELVLDYSSFDGMDDHALLETIQADALFAMYSGSTELDGEAVGEYKIFGVMDGRTVFYQRQHNMQLRIQLDYGAYMGLVRFDRETLTGSGRYAKALAAAQWEFDRNGLNRTPPTAGGQTALERRMAQNVSSQEKGNWLDGELRLVSVHNSPLLMLETFKYYFEIPKYMYSTVPAISKYSLFAFVFNTLLIMGWAVLTQITLCSTSAYALSRLFSRRMAKLLMMFFLVTMMIPFICILLPQMIMMKQIGALNNYAAMLLPYLYPSAFYIFLFKGFFDRLPQDLLDAAKMDGASQLYIFLKICMPLSWSITSMLVLNVIVSAWNDFFWYLSAANRTNLWTINLALYSISINPSTKTNVSMGIALMTIFPVILLTLIFQRQIKESVISAGIKG